MLAEASMGLTALQTAFNLAKGMKGLDTAVAVNSAVIELQENIISAQHAQTALIKRVDELEKEVAGLKAWDGEKERYELKQLYRGPFAYILKEGKEGGEDAHALCTNCYQRGFKSFLQMSGDVHVHSRTWDCAACKMSVKDQWSTMADWITKTRSPA